jgi:trypsin
LAASNFVIALGGLDRWNRSANTLYISVSKIVSHKGYNKDTFKDDIAVMILSEDVPSNHPTAQPISLSTENAVAGRSCRISGWGLDKYDVGNQPNRLVAANVNVNSRSECNQANRYGGDVLNGMFCAGPFAGGIDSCQGNFTIKLKQNNKIKSISNISGDSGGPLTCNGILVGVTSNGKGCALPNFPGVYMDVNYYRKWIVENNSTVNFANFVIILSAVLLSILNRKLY